MMKPYIAPAGPPLSKDWLNKASTVSHVISYSNVSVETHSYSLVPHTSQTANPNIEMKEKRLLSTCFLPSRASTALSLSSPAMAAVGAS